MAIDDQANAQQQRPIRLRRLLADRRLRSGAGGFFLVLVAALLMTVGGEALMAQLGLPALSSPGGVRAVLIWIEPAWVVGTLALFWLGLPWAVALTMIAVLVDGVAFSQGLEPGWSAVGASGLSLLALLAYHTTYRLLPLRHDLRSGKALSWFVLASVMASGIGSFRALIQASTLELSSLNALSLWQTMWIALLLQSCLLVAPTLMCATPRVERLKRRALSPEVSEPGSTTAWISIAVIAAWSLVVAVVWINGVLLARSRHDEGLGGLAALQQRRIEGAARRAGLQLTMVLAAGAGAVLLLAARWSRSLQAEVQSRTAELQESQQRYALAARGANDGLWDWSLRTGEMHLSPRWRAMLGVREEELGQGLEGWLALVHADDREQLEASLNAHIEGHTSHFQGEYRMLHSDGTYRWMLVRALCYRGDGIEALRVAGSITDITERRQAEDQLLHDALHDELTGLPNRALVLDRLSGAIARSRRHEGYLFAVLFLDLDRFKVINDSLGHSIGDLLLIEIAARLTECLRPVDTVARLGGDEFAILLDDIARLDNATELATRVQEQISRPFDLEGHEVYTSASIGIATSKTGYQSADDALRDADTAMYRAKNLGKARHQVFDTAMHARAMHLMLLETDLRRAAESNDFSLDFQPIVSLTDQSLVGLEALLRWRHSSRGHIPRSELVPLAEETGLILGIGHWVLQKACRQLADWKRQFAAAAGLSVSVNLSARQLGQAELINQIEMALSSSGLSPSFLRLEITEEALNASPEISSQTLETIASLGIAIDIDDFGYGASSLSSLDRYPIARVKIDRTKINDLPGSESSLTVVRAVLGLASGFGLECVAEGVESREQCELLRELGCDLAQGFIFSKPLTIAEIEQLLDAGGRLETWRKTDSSLA